MQVRSVYVFRGRTGEACFTLRDNLGAREELDVVLETHKKLRPDERSPTYGEYPDDLARDLGFARLSYYRVDRPSPDPKIILN
ncbi:hypothetical protein [Jeongeupia sp. USM3]|uniref:hypothetical protein n=1 Tax=Jeongeupia sp. USM3 TaxID=1906741 RepID=UPI00089E0224|nr:hypothetical protein [Jeongeupia sp. USM3]AOX99548.1 hypothetical protein BJP62_03205 [Jeongeupia sp. USM3]